MYENGDSLSNNVGTVTVTGGTVYAEGGDLSANNGGIASTDTKAVITGGNVHMNRNNNAGFDNPQHPVNSDGTALYCTTIQVGSGNNLSKSAKVLGLTIKSGGSDYSYETSNMYTDSDGKVYLWLPEGAVVTEVKTANGTYTGTCTTNTSTTSDNTGSYWGTASETFNLQGTEMFIPVEDIILQDSVYGLGEHDLSDIAGITPDNATNKTITWSVENSGTTGASISDNTLTVSGYGTFTLKATVTNGESAETDYTKTFTIRNLGDASITDLQMEGWTYGDTPKVPTYQSDSNAAPKYEYKKKEADDSAYTTTVPTAAGDYTVRVTLPETDKYKEAKATADFTISPKALSAADITVDSIADCYFTGRAVELTSDRIVIRDNGTPLTVGNDYNIGTDYTNNTNLSTEGTPASVSLTGTGNYTGTRTVTFKIVQKPITAVADVSPSGWTNGIVTITAPDTLSGVKQTEYIISNVQYTATSQVETLTGWQTYDGDNKPKITDEANKSYVYVRITDNAGNITYLSSEDVLADGSKPTITGMASSAVTVNSATVTVTATDVGSGVDSCYLYCSDSSSSVTADSVKSDGTANTNGNFALTGLAKNTTYYIYAVAEDKAGNLSDVKTEMVTTAADITLTCSATADTITVTPLADQGKYGPAMYRLGSGGAWQDSNVFSNLSPDTAYTVYAKYAGNSLYAESESVCTSVKTMKRGVVTSPQITAAYGQTLSGVTLPTDWEWTAPGTTITQIGTQSYQAKFTPTDTGVCDDSGVDGYYDEGGIYILRNLSVEVSRATPVITWSLASQNVNYTGNAIEQTKLTLPTVTLVNGDSYDPTANPISYSYRKTDSSGAFTSGLPKEIGSYTVRASVHYDDTTNYTDGYADMTLTVGWLQSAPEAQMTRKDSQDSELSDTTWGYSVILTAPADYMISGSATGTYNSAIDYRIETGASGAATTYYLKNASGEIAEKSATIYIDRTAPTGTITIRNKSWNSFLSTITFGLYVPKDEEVTISPEDTLSGVKTTEYLISATSCTNVSEVQSLGGWQAYSTGSKPKISSEGSYYVYAKITDKVGNVTYLSSDSVLMDDTSPTDVAITPSAVTDSTAAVSVTAGNTGSGVDSYYLYHSTANTTVLVETVKNSGDKSISGSFRLSNLSAHTTYYLYAVAEDKAGNVSPVQTASITTKIKAPVITPAGGSFTDSVSVSISAGADVKIYYTTDGSNPTTNSAEYTEAFTLTSTTTVKAIAVEGDELNPLTSDMTQVQFTKKVNSSGGSSSGGKGSSSGGSSSGSTTGNADNKNTDIGTGNNGAGNGTGTVAPGQDWNIIPDIGNNRNTGNRPGSILPEEPLSGNDNAVVPGSVFDTMRGKDITVIFDLDNGMTWSVNGKSITANHVKEIDFAVTTGTKTIPVEIINNVTGERYSVCLSLAYDGEFGFTAVLCVNLDASNAGLFANLSEADTGSLWWLIVIGAVVIAVGFGGFFILRKKKSGDE